MRKNIIIGLAVLILIPVIIVIAPPYPIDAAPWAPPAAPEIDQGTVNSELQSSQLLALGQIYGPEDVAVDKHGRVYGGTQDGKIVRVNAQGRVETWVTTGGRPLGLHFDRFDNLIVCDAYKGLLLIDQRANVTVLANEAEGTPFRFTNDLDIASDGKIYFSDASSKWNQSQYMLDLLETRPYGRLLAYDPKTEKTSVLMKDLYFANGVALSQQEDFVLVNETWRYRIWRYWLKGNKKGTVDIFVDNLPGFPDGISANRSGRFWLALPTLRLPNVDAMHPKPWLKNIVTKLPESLRPKPVDYGFVLGLNEQGDVEISLHDPDGSTVKEVTSVEEHEGYLYLGSLHNDRIGKFKLETQGK